jgi:transcriptional regulator with XRE-family HTH domain
VDSEPDAVPLAARLRLLRTRLGLSQEQLARRLGVSFATVNRWESGRSQPSARARRALAELETAAASPEPPPGPESAEEQPGRLPIAQSSFVGREREFALKLPGSILSVDIGPGYEGCLVQESNFLAGTPGVQVAADTDPRPPGPPTTAGWRCGG